MSYFKFNEMPKCSKYNRKLDYWMGDWEAESMREQCVLLSFWQSDAADVLASKNFYRDLPDSWKCKKFPGRLHSTQTHQQQSSWGRSCTCSLALLASTNAIEVKWYVSSSVDLVKALCIESLKPLYGIFHLNQIQIFCDRSGLLEIGRRRKAKWRYSNNSPSKRAVVRRRRRFLSALTVSLPCVQCTKMKLYTASMQILSSALPQTVKFSLCPRLFPKILVFFKPERLISKLRSLPELLNKLINTITNFASFKIVDHFCNNQNYLFICIQIKNVLNLFALI